jgi:HrpA-like RNA helicase
VLPLHGDLKPEAQDQVFTSRGRRRVILSTNVAETSVTVPGVGVVIDAGLVRQTRYHDGRGVLRMVPVAMDAAEQRRGRAGRLGPGHCIRLWSQAANLEPVTRPEVLREALTDLTLMVASCGEDPQALPWLDPPPEYALRSAREHLQRIGCLDPRARITQVGQEVARLPLDAGQARVLEAARGLVRREGAPEALLHDVVDLTAALSPGRRLLEQVSGELSEERKLWQKPGCDATAHILALRHGKANRDGLHPWVLQEARRIARQLRGWLKLGAAPRSPSVDRRWLARAWMEADPHTAFARRKRGDHFAGHGVEVEVARESLLKEDQEALIAADVYTTRDRKGRVHKLVTCAIPMKLSTLEEAGLGQDELRGVRARGKKLVATIARTLGGRDIQEREEVPRGPLAEQALLKALQQGSVFRRQVEETRGRVARWNLYRRLKNLPDPPAQADQWLQEQVEALGFEDGRDLALLLGDDFLWPWPAALYEAERQWLDRNYPLQFQWHTTTYDVTYQVARRTVTLEAQGRGKHPLPPLTFLPSWPGWRIQHRKASNVTVLRR